MVSIASGLFICYKKEPKLRRMRLPTTLLSRYSEYKDGDRSEPHQINCPELSRNHNCEIQVKLLI